MCRCMKSVCILRAGGRGKRPGKIPKSLKTKLQTVLADPHVKEQRQGKNRTPFNRKESGTDRESRRRDVAW